MSPSDSQNDEVKENLPKESKETKEASGEHGNSQNNIQGVHRIKREVKVCSKLHWQENVTSE